MSTDVEPEVAAEGGASGAGSGRTSPPPQATVKQPAGDEMTGEQLEQLERIAREATALDPNDEFGRGEPEVTIIETFRETFNPARVLELLSLLRSQEGR